jgi:MFS family permease
MSESVTTSDRRGDRPTTPLPRSALVRISLFWLGLTSIDAVVNSAVQSKIKFEHLVAPGTEGSSLAIVALLTFIFSVAIQPTVGSISDYAETRWGRRKPFIVGGAIFDALFLIGIATSNSLLSIAAFATLLAFSTNVARGPFQGYVPDLVPEKQVGTASSMVGLFQVVGNVVGFGLSAFADIEGNVGLAILAVAAIELVTMLSVVLRVPKGPSAKPRNGRSWGSIAAETWGTDILRETSYLWLLASRLFILMGGAALLNFVKLYLADVHGLDQAGTGAAFINMLVAATLVSLIAIVPASRLSDHFGRKPVIFVCTGLGIAGVGLIAIAPSLTFATIGAALFGASQGTFLAVDWALMTDIIPRASSGRYMGLSNVVTASATTIAVAIGGPVIDALNKSAGIGAGERVELFLGVGYFIVGALALMPVREPKRRGPDRLDAQTEPVASA